LPLELILVPGGITPYDWPSTNGILPSVCVAGGKTRQAAAVGRSGRQREGWSWCMQGPGSLLCLFVQPRPLPRQGQRGVAPAGGPPG
jgi:hypothetical protein